MHIREGSPETIFSAFHEAGEFEEPILCLFLCNDAETSGQIRLLVQDALAVDSAIGKSIALLVLAPALDQALYTKSGSTGFFFPGWSPGAEDARPRGDIAETTLVRSGWPWDEQMVQAIISSHRRISEEFCDFLGLAPQRMPYCVLAVRGITEPWGLPVPRAITAAQIKHVLSEIASLAAEVDMRAERKMLDDMRMRKVLASYQAHTESIAKLQAESRKQLDRVFRYHRVPLLVQDKAYRHAEQGTFSIDDVFADPAYRELASNQNLRKVERLSRELCDIVAARDGLVDQHSDLAENAIAYFRRTEGAEADFKRAVEAIVGRLGGAGTQSSAQILKKVDAAGKALQTIGNLIAIAKKIVAA